MILRRYTYLFLCICALGFISCETGLQPINYNIEQCASCKMIISDKRFGAELVTHKGKVYKYDATECLLRTLVENGLDKYEHIGINYFTAPGKLVDGRGAYFLVSKNIPSPMGGNLSAYPSHPEATKFKVEQGGDIFTFDEILKEYTMVYGQ